MTRTAQLRRPATALMLTASALALASTSAAAHEVLFSSAGVTDVSPDERVVQTSGVTQVRLDNGVTLSFVDNAEYRINADGTVDLFAGSVTIAGAGAGGDAASGIVRMPDGATGRVTGSGSAAVFSISAAGTSNGHTLTGLATITRGRTTRDFGGGEIWQSAGRDGVRRVISGTPQAVPAAVPPQLASTATQPPAPPQPEPVQEQPRVADLATGGPLAAAENGLPVSMGGQLAAAGASSDILAAAQAVEAASANPSLDTFPTGDLALLVAAAADLESAYGGTPFPQAQADIIRTYLGFLADGGAGTNFLAAYAGFLTQYLDLIRSGALPSSFQGSELADVNAFLAYRSRLGTLGQLSAQNRVLAQAYLDFLASGRNVDGFARSYTDLVNAYFAFVRGGGDPLAFAGASRETLDAYVAFLSQSGLNGQLASADRALLDAYLANGGLAFTGQYRSALNAYFVFLRAGNLPSDYTGGDLAALRSYLETLQAVGLFDTVLGAQAGFYADYLAFLRGGGNPDAFAGLNANIFGGYAAQLAAFYDYLNRGGLPSGYTELTQAQIAAFVAALEAQGASTLFLDDLAGFYTQYATFLATGGNPDLFTGLPALNFPAFAAALNAYAEFLQGGGLPASYTAAQLAVLADYIGAIQNAGRAGELLGANASLLGAFFAHVSAGGTPNQFAGLPLYGTYVSALQTYYAFLAGGGVPSDYSALSAAQIQQYLAALGSAGGLGLQLGGLSEFYTAYFAFISGGGIPSQFAGLPLYGTYVSALQTYYAFLAGGGVPSDYSALSAAQIQQYLAALGSAGGLGLQLGDLSEFYTAYFAFISSGGIPSQFAGLPLYDTYVTALNAYYTYLAGGGLPAAYGALTQAQIQQYLAALNLAGGFNLQLGGDVAAFFTSYFTFVSGGGNPAQFAGLPVYSGYVTALNAYYTFLAGGGLPDDYAALTQAQIAAYLDALAGVQGGFGAFAGLNTFFASYFAFIDAGGDPAEFAGLPVYADYLVAIQAFYAFLAGGGVPSAYTALTQAQVQAYLAALQNAGLLAANFNGDLLAFYTNYLAFLVGGGVPDAFTGLPGNTTMNPPVSLAYTGGFNPSNARINFITTLRLDAQTVLAAGESGFGATAYTLNANGGLTAYTRSGGITRTIGTMTLAEVSGNGDALIGRWNNGTNTGANVFTLNANQGLHYALVRPVASNFALPTQGRIDYNLLAATRPTIVDGTLAPGSVTADMAILLGSPLHKIGFEATLTMPGASGGANQTRSYSTTGGVANPSQSSALVGSVTGGNFFFSVPGTGSTSCAIGTCEMSVSAVFAGDNDTIGLTYSARNDEGDAKVLIGAMIFGNGLYVPAGFNTLSAPLSLTYAGGFNPATTRINIASTVQVGSTFLSGGESNFVATAYSLNAQGGLTGYTREGVNPGSPVVRTSGSAALSDVSGTANVLIGRWNDITTNDANQFTFSANQGLHYMMARLVPSGFALPTTGIISYDLLAATRPTIASGSSPAGHFTGDMALVLGATPKVAFEAVVTMPGQTGQANPERRYSTVGGIANPQQSTTTISQFSGGAFTFLVPGSGGTACATTSCNFSATAQFAGGTEQVGLTYVARDDTGSSNAVIGAAIFGNGALATTGGGGGGGGSGSAGTSVTSTFSGTRNPQFVFTQYAGNTGAGFSATTATLANGALTRLSHTANGSTALGTASAVEAGDSGVLAWARWTNGTVTTTGSFTPFTGSTITLGANGGYHVLSGTPTTNTAPLTGTTINYELIGTTAATDNLGTTPGTVTGDLAIMFGASTAQSKVGFDFTVALGGRSWTVTTPGGGASNPGGSDVTLGLSSGVIFSKQFFTPGADFTSTGGACARDCIVGVTGALFGASAQNAGVAIRVLDSVAPFTSQQIDTLAIFGAPGTAGTAAAPASSAIAGAAPADWGRWDVPADALTAGNGIAAAAPGLEALAASGIQFNPEQIAMLNSYMAGRAD